MKTATKERLSILAELRALVPERRLTLTEAKRLCELQADRLRALYSITTPELPEDAILSLPRIELEERLDIETSGFSYWHDGHWVIVINALEPWQRQRFTTAHELWHVINYRTVRWLLPSDAGTMTASERLADYFAGCLLMPRRHLRQAVHQGYDIDNLADLFGVSTAAVAVRIRQLGLPQPTSLRESTAWKN